MKNFNFLHLIALILVLGGIRVLFDGSVANVGRISADYPSARTILRQQNQTEMSDLILSLKIDKSDKRRSEACQTQLLEIIRQSGRELTASDMNLTLSAFSSYPLLFEPLFFEEIPSSRETAKFLLAIKKSALESEISLDLPEGFHQIYRAVLRKAVSTNLISNDGCSLVEE